jgi:hypothetical protein
MNSNKVLAVNNGIIHFKYNNISKENIILEVESFLDSIYFLNSNNIKYYFCFINEEKNEIVICYSLNLKNKTISIRERTFKTLFENSKLELIETFCLNKDDLFSRVLNLFYNNYVFFHFPKRLFLENYLYIF